MSLNLISDNIARSVGIMQNSTNKESCLFPQPKQCRLLIFSITVFGLDKNELI